MTAFSGAPVHICTLAHLHTCAKHALHRFGAYSLAFPLILRSTAASALVIGPATASRKAHPRLDMPKPPNPC